MTTPVIDLTILQSGSPLPTATLSIITTTTTTLPPTPTQPQQSIANLILLKRIGKLKQHMAELVQSNLDLEERYESVGISGAQELSPTDSLIHDDPIPDEQVHLSDDEDFENDHLPKADSRQDWWKPLPKEERPVTPEPTWTIPSFNVSDIKNNWASVLVSTYETPTDNSLLAKTGDKTTFMKWYCRQFQMEECYKMFTDQIEWTNLEGDQFKVDVNQPLPLGGPPGGSIDRSSILTDMILRRVEKMSEHTCGFSVSSGSKHTQDTGHLNHLPGSEKQMLSTAVKLWTQNLVIRQRVEDFQLGIESYQT
ncbi:hypothetical protein Tco_1202477 [Tanacetum coccineum]